MYLINDDQRHILHIVSCLPGPADAVPLLRSRDYHVGLFDGADIGRDVTWIIKNFTTFAQKYKIFGFINILFTMYKVG